MKNVGLVSLILVLASGLPAYSQINVGPAQTALALAQKLAGQGVTILNQTLNCPAVANGLFTVVSSNLGLDSGIVLTTGRSATIGGSIGVNGKSSLLASTDNGVAGDPSLDALAGEPTLDACSLEFDVIPSGDSIHFNYVFSSEEYKNAVCGPYNDAFAFFISGPGIVGTDNMALVPGTNIPVTINSINDGIPGSTGNLSNCTSMGAGSPFTAYYTDNSSGITLTHQGLTKILQARHAVTPCNTYHLKLAIADAGDPLYDSGVFLEAGSLQATNYHISAVEIPIRDTSEAFCIKGCQPGTFRIRRSQALAEPQTVRFTEGGDAISGVDYSPMTGSVVIPANDTIAFVTVNGIPTPAAGARTLKIYIQSPYNCAGTNNIVDSSSMIIYDSLHVSMLTTDTTVCGGDSIQLSIVGSDLLTYSWSPGIWLTNSHLQDPLAFPYVSTDYVVTAFIPGISCPPKTASVNLTIKLTPEIELQHTANVCFNTMLSLNALTVQPNDYYSFQWSGPVGFSSSLQTPTVNFNDAQTAGNYTLTVTNDTNYCRASATIAIDVIIPDTPNVTSPTILCLNTTPAPLSAKGENIKWYDAADTTGNMPAPVTPTNTLTTYNYYVTQTVNGCESPKAPVEVEVKKCCDGNIFIPTAFTPNDDGLNDKFRALPDYGYDVQSMHIFNRWGQLVYSGLNNEWDGKFGGRPVDVGTYFYSMTFGCILGGSVERKGDVTVIR